MTAQSHSFLANETRVLSEPSLHDSRVTLDQAYAVSRQITREYSKSFYLSSLLLPSHKRQAIHALYGFCRVSDNIVDHGDSNALEELARWRHAAFRPLPEQQDPVLMAWADVRERYHVPRRYAEELLDGMAMDLTLRTYQTWEELSHYCYCVASTVGLMSMHITGFNHPEAFDYAVKLGIALQLTNILRDVGEDASRGRVYLPLEDIEHFGLTYAHFCHGQVDERFVRLLDFEIERAERLYNEAWPGIGLLSPDSRLSVATAAIVYRGILNKIRQNRYDVFNQRAHLGLGAKLVQLPRVWWRVRRIP